MFTNLFPPCYLRSTNVASESDEGETEDDLLTNDDIDSDTEHDTDDDSYNDDGDAPNEYLSKSHDLRQEFLSQFSDDEVVEIWHVYNFMVFTSVRVRNATSEPTLHDCGLRIHIRLRLFLMDARPSSDLLLWNGPSTAAGVLRSMRSFENPGVCFVEQLNWDYGRPDAIWPGFVEYLEEKNYNLSKVRTNIWDPIPGSDAILDKGVEDNEGCESTRYSLLLKHSWAVGEECHIQDLGPRLWSSSSLCRLVALYTSG